MDLFDDLPLPLEPPTILDDLLDWIVDNPFKVLTIVVFLISAAMSIIVLWQQDWHDFSVDVRIDKDGKMLIFNNNNSFFNPTRDSTFHYDAQLLFRYKEAVDVDSTSKLTIRFVPHGDVNYTKKIHVGISENNKEYLELDKPYVQELTISPKMQEISDNIGFSVFNPPWSVKKLGFTASIQMEGRKAVLTPIVIKVQRYRNVPLWSSGISVALFFVAAALKKFFSIG